MMGRRRRQGNCTPQNNNSMEDLVVNEENEYLVQDLNNTKISVINELSDTNKKISQRGKHGCDY
jgi:hypothetical protein